jgi:hypothetical protein
MFKCCHKCTPPKRTPGCHDHCGEYQAEKAARDRKKKQAHPEIKSGLYRQRDEAVARATKRRRK